jgi:TonB family protein
MRSLLTALLLCILTTGINQGQESSQSGPVVKVSPFEMAARLATTVTPKFPETPMVRCSMAVVNLDAIIGEDGKVRSVKVTSGFEEFRESAIAAVKQWTYKPYLVNGVPVPVETTVGVVYVGNRTAGPFYVLDKKNTNINSLKLPADCGPPVEIKQAPPK